MVMVLWKFVSGKEKTMTMTKISSKKTCYTYGHGPLISLLQKSDRSVRKGDRKVTESVPKTKKVIELLLPTSSLMTLNSLIN